MIVGRLVNQAPSTPVPPAANPGRIDSGRYRYSFIPTRSKKTVTEDSAKKVATVYSCANTIADDIGMMPLQLFNRFRGNVTRLFPDMTMRNLAYLLEIQPNRWMTPFLWKRTIANWLQFWGNCYIWAPASIYPELFILGANMTEPKIDQAGNKWYETTFPNGVKELIPDVEIAHLMINSPDGMSGRSVLEYARETIGRQLAAHETQDSISGDGLKPTAAITVNAPELSPEAREVVRRTYIDAAGSGAAVFDNRISKFETITMKPTDAQFLEGIAATDSDIANFWKFPLHKLNMGKQSYESNEQQELNYVRGCLNPYLIQTEQVGRLKWIAEIDQPFQYIKFNRDSLLQMDAKTRSEVIKNRIQTGVMTPNQALAVEDENGYPGGDGHYMPSNIGLIQADGSISGGTATASPTGGNGQ